MPADLTTLPPGPRPPEVVYAIIEISKGERNKYEYDPELGVFRLDRVLYSAVHYPAAYGFIPSTQAADGDPVDILVLTTETTFTGCLIEARPVGIFRMRDRKGEDEKILAVPTVDPRFSGIVDLAGLPAHFLREVEHFFTIYKDLEGETVETFGWADRAQALEVIRRCLRQPWGGG
jgi:inorganic pyrophosphatase